MKLAFKSAALLLIGCLFQNAPAIACGGLFCQNVPVDQAGEQILFHQDGEYITAMVRILYEGDSENFSWVVPVPTTPELSTGADVMFDELEQLTSPRFTLERNGNVCESDLVFINASTSGATDAGSTDAESDGVVIEQSLSVGPFDIEIVSSTNPDEMAQWLEDNDYDLSSRGRELITPYVEVGMKFVAVKLRSGESSGSIQPLIMKYKSDMPMVPIKLTAVAAQDDMGVLVWLVSDARAVPNNYLHVVPNYTKLNWYTGSQNAYASYQSLITTAMDEAGGQGFATDFAGPITGNITDFMSSSESRELELQMFDELQSDAEFLSRLYNSSRSDGFRSAFQRILPLPQGQDQSAYSDPFAMLANYSPELLSQARINARQALVDIEIDPLKNSNALVQDGRYLTRLYTTLSADEMTVDPSFEFNANMPGQARERKATLDQLCIDNERSEWSLTLGEGTGREGERVILSGNAPPTIVPVAVTAQRSVFSTSITSGAAMPQIQTKNEFELLELNRPASTEGEIDSNNEDVGTDVVAQSSKNKFLGSSSAWWLFLALSIIFVRRRKL